MASGEIESLLESVSTSTSKAEACTFDMDMSASLDVNAGEQSVSASITGGGEGSIDIVNEKMYIPLTVNLDAPGYGSESMDMEMYIVDGWAYMKMDTGMFGGDSGWTKMELPAETLEELDLSIVIGQLTGLMDLVTIYDKGSEPINGVACDKYQMSPDMEQLIDYAFEQFEQEGIDMEDLDLSELEGITSAFSVDCMFWIAQEENLLMKVELVLSGDISSEDIPELAAVGFGSIEIDMTATVVFDYPQSVDITVPDEALLAETVDTEIPFI